MDPDDTRNTIYPENLAPVLKMALLNKAVNKSLKWFSSTNIQHARLTNESSGEVNKCALKIELKHRLEQKNQRTGGHLIAMTTKLFAWNYTWIQDD